MFTPCLFDKCHARFIGNKINGHKPNVGFRECQLSNGQQSAGYNAPIKPMTYC